MTKRLILRLLIAGTAMLLTPLAGFANITGVTLNATVDQFVVLQIETAAGAIISPDDLDSQPGSPASNEVLNFGTVDAMAINSGTLTATNGPASGVLDKQLLIGGSVMDESTFTGSMANTDGAVYFINSGYQLRALRNDGGVSMNVDVDVVDGTNPALDAIIDLDAANTFADASVLSGRRTANAAATALTAGMALNTAIPIDLGIIVPLNTLSGAKETVITFTGT